MPGGLFPGGFQGRGQLGELITVGRIDLCLGQSHGLPEVRFGEIGISQRCLGQVGPFEVGALQIRLLQVSPLEMAPCQAGSPEIGSLQVGAL